MHYFADRLQAGPFARTYMFGYEQIMRKKSIKSRKYRVHSPSKRQNILIFHQNPLQHPISSLSACHVIIYCDIVYDIVLKLKNPHPFRPKRVLLHLSAKRWVGYLTGRKPLTNTSPHIPFNSDSIFSL